MPADATRHATAHTQLRASEERFRLLVESVRDYAIFMLDPQGRVATWNLGAERIKGYRAEEIIGQHFSRFYPSEDIAAGKPAMELREATAQGRFEDEGWRLRKDGSPFWANVVITALRDEAGCLVGFAKVTRDLTDRKQAEAALRESEAKLRTLADTSPALIWFDDHTGACRSVNHRYLEFFGKTEAEVLGAGWQPLLHPDTGPGYLADLLAAVRERRPFHHRAQMRRHDGQWRWIESRALPLFGGGGEFLGHVGVSSDVTEAVEAEAEIRALNATLERRVAERTAELAAANAQLAVANQDLEAFGYSVAHDLRAPLRALQGLSIALLEDYGARLDETGRDYARQLTDAAKHLDQLLQDLLVFSRVSRADLPLEPVDIAAVVRRAEAQVEADLGRDPGWLTVEGPLPRVLAHAATLFQVVVNLLSNAVKFVAPGVAPRVRVWGEARDGRARLWVEDNGLGIAPEHYARIFRVFERLHGAEAYPGTGVGLAIVQRAVERMGGKAGVESAVGRGSRFWIELAGG